MKPRALTPKFGAILLPALLAVLTGCACLENCPCMKTKTDTSTGPVGFLVRTNYHGWEDALLLSNGRVEAIIVPQVGRIMQFRLVGDDEGVFWENPKLYGQTADPSSTNWANFGGDKAWPAPQSEWKEAPAEDWPPPEGFDARPYAASVDGWVVTLTSQVDPRYQTRVTRRIQLANDAPVMTIRTRFEKVGGGPDRISVWVVTQLRDPVAVFAPLRLNSIFDDGYRRLSYEDPKTIEIDKGLLSLRREPSTAYKIGLDGDSLFWLDQSRLLRIDSMRESTKTYPDYGSSTEIYTADDAMGDYVELEMLGPLTKMVAGSSIERVSTYTLLRRTELDPKLEVRLQLAH